jgi:hypothetical protein
MEIIRSVTRWVILGKKRVYKFPALWSWKLFLIGLLANMQEADFWTMKDERLCPVLFHIWGGWLVVMPRVEVCHGKKINFKQFKGLPTDQKSCNVGIYNNREVLIDYGSSGNAHSSSRCPYNSESGRRDYQYM